MRQWSWPSLAQIMACRLFGATPLSEPVLFFCQLGHSEQMLMKFEYIYKDLHSRNECENVVCNFATISSRLYCVKTVNIKGDKNFLPFFWQLQFSHQKLHESLCTLVILLLFEHIDGPYVQMTGRVRCPSPHHVDVGSQNQLDYLQRKHDDVIKWKHFPPYRPFVRGIHRWIPRTKASDAELWFFLWSASEWTVE